MIDMLLVVSFTWIHIMYTCIHICTYTCIGHMSHIVIVTIIVIIIITIYHVCMYIYIYIYTHVIHVNIHLAASAARTPPRASPGSRVEYRCLSIYFTYLPYSTPLY